MKITEIRIGNLITYQDENETTEPIIIKVGVSDIVLMNENFKSVKYEPIKLTEEWLIKLGFIKIGLYYHFPKNDIFKLQQHKLNNAWWLRYYTESLDCVRINFVNQLQNLYYSLTGEELNLN